MDRSVFPSLRPKGWSCLLRLRQSRQIDGLTLRLRRFSLRGAAHHERPLPQPPSQAQQPRIPGQSTSEACHWCPSPAASERPVRRRPTRHTPQFRVQDSYPYPLRDRPMPVDHQAVRPAGRHRFKEPTGYSFGTSTTSRFPPTMSVSHQQRRVDCPPQAAHSATLSSMPEGASRSAGLVDRSSQFLRTAWRFQNRQQSWSMAPRPSSTSARTSGTGLPGRSTSVTSFSSGNSPASPVR